MKFYQALLIFISAIAGTGIFFTPIILTSITGSFIYQIRFWIFIGILFILYAIVFSNMIYIFPKKGGIYDYVKNLNNHIGFAAGWLEYFSIVIISSFLLNLSISSIAPLFKIDKTILGTIIVLIFMIIILLGLKISVKALTLFGLFTLITFLSVFFYSYYLFLNINFEQLAFTEKFKLDYLSIIIASIFETYAGVEILGYFADKKNYKNLARATLLGGLILFSLYILLVFAMILDTLYFKDFYSLHRTGVLLKYLVSFQMLGTILAWMISSSNLLLRMSEDENLPKIFSLKNKYDVPTFSLSLTSILVLFFYITGFFEILVKYYFVSIIIIYILVATTILKVHKPPFMPRNIVKLSAALAIVISLILLLEYGREALFIFPFLLIGLSFYLGKELQRNKRLTAIFHDIFSPFIDLFWRVIIKEDIKIIEKLVGNLDRKIVLDFGSSTGNISIHFAKKYDCIIYSSDISRISLAILKLKTRLQKILNIVPMMDKPDRIFEKFIDFFDVVLAYHSLSFVKDYEIFLNDLKRALKKEGIFVAIIYDNIFKIFECPAWIKDIDKELKKAGFDPIIIKKKGKLWDKIIIYARKIS